MPHHATPLSSALAEAIYQWHFRTGKAARPPHKNDEEYAAHIKQAAHFLRADLSDPAVQLELAEAQRSGYFEWAYGCEIDPATWKDLCKKYQLQAGVPRHLGEASQWLLGQFAEDSKTEGSDRHVEGSNTEGVDRQGVKAWDEHALVQAAREFYADVATQERAGVGGINALLSSSLERNPWPSIGSSTVLLRPEVMGLQVVSRGQRKNDLIDAILDGDVVIEDVIGYTA